MNEILSSIPVALCLIDDILIYGSTRAEHDKNFQAVLERIQSVSVTLNKEKCEFGKAIIKFLGHIISPEGIENNSCEEYETAFEYFRTPSLS